MPVQIKDDKKLDNPVWFSLTETHRNLATGDENIKFYLPEYCPFGGFQEADHIAGQIDKYAAVADNFFIVGEKPALSSRLILKKEVICLQMIIHERTDILIKEPVVPLTAGHADELFELVNLVQPGYFKKKTSLLGITSASF